MYTVLVIRRRGWNDWQVGEKGRSTQAGFLPKVDELNTLDSPARSIPQWPARRELEKEKREDVRKSEQPWYWHWQWKWAAIDGAGERQTGDESSACPCFFFGVFLFPTCNGVSVGYSSFFPSCSVLVFVLDLFPNNRLSLPLTLQKSPDPPPPSYPTLSFLSQHWDSTQAPSPAVVTGRLAPAPAAATPLRAMADRVGVAAIVRGWAALVARH